MGRGWGGVKVGEESKKFDRRCGRTALWMPRCHTWLPVGSPVRALHPSSRVSRSARVVHTQGARRASAGHRTPTTRPLRTGLKAGRPVRPLADTRPPYRATELARHSELSLPYISRVLDTLDDQLLIQRDREVIASVDRQRRHRPRGHPARPTPPSADPQDGALPYRLFLLATT